MHVVIGKGIVEVVNSKVKVVERLEKLKRHKGYVVIDYHTE